MGCDIHFYVEHRTPNGWERLEKMVPNRWYSPPPEEPDDPRLPALKAEIERVGALSTSDPESDKYDDLLAQYKEIVGVKYNSWQWEEDPMVRDTWYTGRNYDLFAILADVRNGVGFAGCDTGDGFVPIFKPRGLPDDVSDEVGQASDDYGVDGHSHSYFDLNEWYHYDLDQVTKDRMLVSPKRGARYRNSEGEWTTVPEEWPFGEEGDGSVACRPSTSMFGMRDEQPMDRTDTPAHKIATDWRDSVLERWNSFRRYPEGGGCGGVSGSGAQFYRVLEREIYYHEAVGESWLNCIRRMTEAAVREHDGDLTAVRATFWFDN